LSNDNTTPNKGSLPFPFQPTYYLFAAIHDLSKALPMMVLWSWTI
jgi:hypothetical protein